MYLCGCVSDDARSEKTHGWSSTVAGNTCLFGWIQLWCWLFWQTFKTVKASISPRSLESKGEMCGPVRFVYSAVHSAPSVCQMSKEPSSQKWEGPGDFLRKWNRIVICIALPRIALLEQTQVSRWLRRCICTIHIAKCLTTAGYCITPYLLLQPHATLLKQTWKVSNKRHHFFDLHHVNHTSALRSRPCLCCWCVLYRQKKVVPWQITGLLSRISQFHY